IQRSAHHYLRIRLEGNAPNTHGIGARIELEAGSRTQVYELQPSRGFQSSVEPVITLGLGNEDEVEKLQVYWPGGKQQRFSGLRADQELVLKESEARDEVASKTGAGETPTHSSQVYFIGSTASSGLGYTHRENEFIDFDREQLMPHMLSTQGPRMARGDVDGNGLEDIYVCGARGQSGALFLQSPGGRFVEFTDEVLATHPEKEETDAAFFDADGDGDLDLYIVSGGGEDYGAHISLTDRLLINEGLGSWKESERSLPPFYSNGSCVQPIDYNGDGAWDLFVGGRSIPGFYGLTPSSYLLENRGDGSFRDVTEEKAESLARIGLVTDAARIEKDGSPRLVIVGEWMPVTVISFTPGGIQLEKLEGSEGWWNAVEPVDLDGDGDLDLLLGNLGLNSDLKASPESPVELFVADFDQNMTTDPIITYYKQGSRYTYFGLDKLSKQLVSLRKRFTDYRSFAESKFEDIFTDEDLEKVVHRRAHTFASAVAINEDGVFSLKDLPMAVQTSPVFAWEAVDMDGDGDKDIVAVGNLRETQPDLGRYDASYGWTLQNDGDFNFRVMDPNQSGWVVPGAGRDILSVIDKNGNQVIVVARNDDSLMTFRLDRKTLLK
ncbi:MAG: FG-GAP-like repeat-containing protein, partial [Saprospiraceae bacterium]|nr:FG-GAP-like repeat-containing protein [Saprospiraceae bacterium]